MLLALLITHRTSLIKQCMCIFCLLLAALRIPGHDWMCRRQLHTHQVSSWESALCLCKQAPLLIILALQGICDNKKKFLDASTGCPSKMHDARIFRRSRIANALPQLCSNKYHIVGDAAYPFREYLMTPIRDYGNFDSTEKAFNASLSGTRVLIENAFGDLKNRFRQLHRLDMWTVDNMSKFIISCCVLHNLCIERGDLPENLSRDLSLSLLTTNAQGSGLSLSQQSSSSGSQQDSLLRALASIKRDRLMIKMGLQRQ